jgi:hypothetical protein
MENILISNVIDARKRSVGAISECLYLPDSKIMKKKENV